MAQSTRLWVAVAALVFAVSTVAHAQGNTTGSLTGTLTDASGGVLPGATVTLSGPNIQGTRTDTTDGQGTYRFRNLPPGRGYRVAASLSGFREAVQDNIQVLLGQEGSVNLTLSPAGVSEQVEVTAATPLVDVSSTSGGVNITSNLFETLPSARGFQQLTAMAPGVALDMGDHDRRFSDSPTVGGSSAPENNYIIDGLSVTDPRYGTSGANLTMNFIQEVQVITSGFQAEYGRSTGGVFNVVTKSGSNAVPRRRVQLQPQQELDGRRPRAAAQQAADDVCRPDRELRRRRLDRRPDRSRQGLVLRGLRTNPAHDLPRLADRRRHPDRYVRPRVRAQLGRLRRPRSPGRRVRATRSCSRPSAIRRKRTAGWPARRPATTRRTPTKHRRCGLIRSGGHNFGAKYTGVLGSNWLLDVSVGRHRQRAGTEAATDAGRRIPRQIDETFALFEHGGFGRLQDDNASRTALCGAYDQPLRRARSPLRPRHGDQRLRRRTRRRRGIASSGRSSRPRGSAATSRSGTTRSAARGRPRARRCSRRTAGARCRTSPSISGCATRSRRSARRTTWPSEENQIRTSTSASSTWNVEPPDGLSLNNNWAPRLGVSWDPLGNGKSKIYGFWGRFYEAIPLDMNIRAINGEDYIITQYVNPVDAELEQLVQPERQPAGDQRPVAGPARRRRSPPSRRSTRISRRSSRIS